MPTLPLAVLMIGLQAATVETTFLGTVSGPQPIVGGDGQSNCSARASATHRGDCKELDGLTLTRESLALGVHPLNTAGFNSTITSFTPRGNSSYHGLASQVTKRYSENFAMTGAYPWSKNIDDSTAALASTVLTPRRPYDFENLRQERANSAAVIASLPLGFMTLLGCAIARRGRCGT